MAIRVAVPGSKPAGSFMINLPNMGRLWAALCLTFFMTCSALPVQAQRAPDENTSARLVWSTMVALDNANRTGNYTVLRELGSPSFQSRNSQLVLSSVFADLRDNRVDVGRAIMTKPTYYLPPTLTPEGELRLRGAFEYRPKSLRFDLIYKNLNGGWRLHAISVAQMDFDAPR